MPAKNGCEPAEPEESRGSELEKIRKTSSGIPSVRGFFLRKTRTQEMGIAESTMTQAAFQQLRVAFFGREIEKVLNQR